MTEAQIKVDEHQEFKPVNIRKLSSRGKETRERKLGLSKPASSGPVKELEKSQDGRSKPATLPRVRKAKVGVQAKSHEQTIVCSVVKTIQEKKIHPNEIDLEKLFHSLEEEFGRIKVSVRGGESSTIYQDKTVVKLKDLLRKRRVGFGYNFKKDQLIQALMDDDNKKNIPVEIGKQPIQDSCSHKEVPARLPKTTMKASSTRAKSAGSQLKVNIAPEGRELRIDSDKIVVDPGTRKKYDAQFKCVDTTKNMNKWYRIWVLEHKERDSYATVAGWGRIGRKTRLYVTYHNSQPEAISYFERKRSEKLGRKGYSSVPPRYLPTGGVDLSGVSDQTFKPRKTGEIPFENSPRSQSENFSNDNCFQTGHPPTPPEEVSGDQTNTSPEKVKTSWLNWKSSK